MKALLCVLPSIALVLAACGGSGQPAEAPESEVAPDHETAPAPAEPVAAAEASAPGTDTTEQSNPSVPEPQFTENMSVDEAVKAVPQGVERTNLDPETLAKPLQSPEIFESCKPGSARVKLRVAVWDGKAVGIDATTTPKNPTLADCIKGKIRELTWEKKVKSLNTIEYQL